MPGAGTADAGAGAQAREPWIAVNLSLFAPGRGEIHAGRVALGVTLVAAQAGLFASCVATAATRGAPIPLFYGLVLLLLVNFAASVLRAHRMVVRSNPPGFEAARRAEKDPWAAAFWSRL